MNRQIHNRRRLRLDLERYRELKKRILERDGWRCQQCGRCDQLQIHHMIRRSQSGPDCDENLIVLCSSCHRSLHLKGT
jgi:5-methylcytosine-specific restriction endonuclease McrA